MKNQDRFQTSRGSSSSSGHRSRPARGRSLGPVAEPLEGRQLPALLLFPAGVTPVVEAEPNDTVDRAQPLGDLGATRAAGARGAIGAGASASADVDWYHFTLDSPATVDLTVGVGQMGKSFRGVVGLYNEDPFDFGDAVAPLGHRLMAQDEAALPGDFAHLTATLGAGSYDVAVSGAGNRFFHPLMANSGYAGSAGEYNLVVSSRKLDLAAGNGPTLLASDPAPGASLDRSPLAIRLDLGAPIDPATVAAGTTVRLVSNPTGAFGDGNDADVALASVNYGAAVGEIQLFPHSALKPGHYRVILAGDAVADAATLAAPDGTPLGADQDHPRGRDLTVSFDVTGIEGGTAADDTLATAHDLGDVTGAGLVQVVGAIGADSYYDSSSPDPALNPGNDVNFYRFRVEGQGPYAFVAEVFAGRIGSPLDAGVALYRVGPTDGSLHFVAGVNNGQDAAVATDGSNPLLLDPTLYASLSAGDYVVAVSSGSNTPAPIEGQAPGSTGLYDPNASHSGQAGFGTGPYVLNLRVEAVPEPPRAVATSPAQGSILTAPPTRLTVRFSEPVDLQQAAYQAYNQTSQGAVASVYVLGSDGTKYFPRLESFDRATNRATFLMLDALPSGSYGLHLSGPGGLTDLAGTPLVGNDPGGDFVVHFQVQGPTRGTATTPLAFLATETTGRDAAAQELGVLFPHEFQAGVTVTRSPSAPATDTEDSFRFEVLQAQTYVFNAGGSDALPSFPLWLTDDKGAAVGFATQGDATQSQIAAVLAPGVYVVHVGRWTPEQAAGLSYKLTLKLQGVADNPTPLLVGPAPALQFRLSALPSPGPSDTPATPVSPAPTAPPAGQESGGGATGPGPGMVSTPPASTQGPSIAGAASEASPSSSSPASALGVVGNLGSIAPAPSHDSGGQGHADQSSGGAGATTSTSPSGYLAPGVSGPVGLVALGFGPVGGPTSTGAAPGLSTVQVAFSLPPEPRTLPSLKGMLSLLFTAPQLHGHDRGTSPGVQIPEPPGKAATDLFRTFDEALRRVTQAGPLPSLEVEPAAALDPSLPPTPVEPGPIPPGPTALAEGATPPDPTTADARAEVEVAASPAGLAWKAALAGLATVSTVLIIRRRLFRTLAPPEPGLQAGPSRDRAVHPPGPFVGSHFRKPGKARTLVAMK